MKKQILIEDTLIVQDINKDTKVFDKGKKYSNCGGNDALLILVKEKLIDLFDICCSIENIWKE